MLKVLVVSLVVLALSSLAYGLRQRYRRRMEKVESIALQGDYDRLLDEVIALEQELTQTSELALTDSLTGLPNRREFDAIWNREVAAAKRTGATVSLLAVDLDCFKSINDTYGHLAGDEALIAVAETIRRVLSRESDVATRVGGDEIMVILSFANAEGALSVAKEIVAEIRAMSFDTGHGVTVSIGVLSCALHCHGDVTAHELVTRVDAAMYRAKNSGGDRAYLAV